MTHPTTHRDGAQVLSPALAAVPRSALDNPTGLTISTALKMADAAGTRVRDDALAGTLSIGAAHLAATAAEVAAQVLACAHTPAGALLVSQQVLRTMQAARTLATELRALGAGTQPLTLSDAQCRELVTMGIVLRVQARGARMVCAAPAAGSAA